MSFSVQNIIDAAARLKGHAVRTPLLEFPALNAATGGRVLVKPEIFQHTGSFKFRGAWSALTLIPESKRSNGVVAWSSGNHAQGVAAAAKILDMPALIVMPSDAPTAKIDGTRALGGEIVFYDRRTEDREAIGRALCAERGATLVPSYDDYGVIAGQGTVGLEIAEDCARLGVTPDAVLAPCSGGGLISGIATAMSHHFPGVQAYAAEPAGYDDLARSLAAGERVAITPPECGSICDALLTNIPGSLTFPILKKLGAKSLVVSDDEVRAAMRFAFVSLKLVVEPGGAAALTALLEKRIDITGKTVVCVFSGGNRDA